MASPLSELVSQSNGNVNSSNCSLNDVPPEVLEIILANLGGMDLLTGRLVNGQWKEALNRLIDTKLLSYFTKWNTHHDHKWLKHLIPSLWVSPSREELDEGKSSLNMFVPKLVFASSFPVTSLQFGMKTLQMPTQLLTSDEESTLSFFFKKKGKLITVLVLDSYKESAANFSTLLSLLPNLKSLTFDASKIQKGEETFNWETSQLPSLPHLTHIQSIRSPPFEEHSVTDAIVWILRKYGAQLVGLTLKGSHLYSYTLNVPFPNLKQVKISSSNKRLLENVQLSGLTHVMITDFNVGNIFQRPDLWLPCLVPFSQTLECLRLPSTTSRTIQAGDAFEGNFEKVKMLSVKLPEEEWEIDIMKSFVLPRFPGLEKLEFVHCTNYHSRMERVVKSEEYWNFCPKLKIISALDDRPDSSGIRKLHVIWTSNEPELN